MRFQHGVCESPTLSPIAAIERVASVWSSARIFRSIESKANLTSRRRSAMRTMQGAHEKELPL